MTSSACHCEASSGSLLASAAHAPPSGLKISAWEPSSVNREYRGVGSAHQKPPGQPVVVETTGFESTIATRFGFFRLTGLRSLWLIVVSFPVLIVRATRRLRQARRARVAASSGAAPS